MKTVKKQRKRTALENILQAQTELALAKKNVSEATQIIAEAWQSLMQGTTVH
jgi:hypothetical protein